MKGNKTKYINIIIQVKSILPLEIFCLKIERLAEVVVWP